MAKVNPPPLRGRPFGDIATGPGTYEKEKEHKGCLSAYKTKAPLPTVGTDGHMK